MIVLLLIGFSLPVQAGWGALYTGAVVAKFCNKTVNCVVSTVKAPWIWYNNGYLAYYAENGDYKNVKKTLQAGWDVEEGGYRALDWAVRGALEVLQRENASLVPNFNHYKKTIKELLDAGSRVSIDEYWILLRATEDHRLIEIAVMLYKKALEQDKNAKQKIQMSALVWKKYKLDTLYDFLLSQPAS